VSRRSVLAMGGAVCAGLGLSACGSPGRPTPATARNARPEDVQSIATDAYVFGYPLVLVDVTRATGAPANQFGHATSLPTPADRRVVRLNLDTLYSSAW